MSDNIIPELPVPAPELRWCGNRVHLLDETAEGRCRRCNAQTALLSKARKAGIKICDGGHGLMRGNLAADGSCNECADVEATINSPGAPVRPAPTTWLDWGAVAAALGGRELLRPLSLREWACLLYTLRVRRPEWALVDVVEWIADSTTVRINRAHASYVLNEWWYRHGLPDPRITLEQAVFAECDGDAWIAEERARLVAERAREDDAA